MSAVKLFKINWVYMSYSISKILSYETQLGFAQIIIRRYKS
jgi:hypothetical protein